MLAVVIALAFVVALLSILVVGLLVSHGAVLRRLHNLDPAAVSGNTAGNDAGNNAAAGSTPGTSLAGTHGGVLADRPDHRLARDISGLSPNGSAVTVGLTAARQPTLLAFLSTGCMTCAGFWDAFRSGQGVALDERGIRLVIVTRGADGESPAEVRRLAPGDVTTVQSNAAWSDYDVPANPYFVLVGAGGVVAGEGAAPGWPALLNLLQRAETDGTLPTGRPIRRRGRSSRLDRSDAHLARVGIGPGHDSLYPPEATESA